jgi:hypothetical protein
MGNAFELSMYCRRPCSDVKTEDGRSIPRLADGTSERARNLEVWVPIGTAKRDAQAITKSATCNCTSGYLCGLLAAQAGGGRAHQRPGSVIGGHHMVGQHVPALKVHLQRQSKQRDGQHFGGSCAPMFAVQDASLQHTRPCRSAGSMTFTRQQHLRAQKR